MFEGRRNEKYDNAMRNNSSYIEREIVESATEIANDDVELWTDKEVADFLAIDEVEVDEDARNEAAEIWAEEIIELWREQMVFESEDEGEFD